MSNCTRKLLRFEITEVLTAALKMMLFIIIFGTLSYPVDISEQFDSAVTGRQV